MADSDLVTLILAYPLSADQAEKVHAEDARNYWIGDEITVPKSHARSIIAAGYAAGIDPADTEAVDRALSGQVPDPDPAPGKRVAPADEPAVEPEHKKAAAKK